MLARKAIVSVIAILISYSMTWAAGPVVKTQPPCNTGGVCMGFGPSPFVVRSLSFTAPSSGQTIVTVNGSGFCQNSNLQSVQVAEFDSEIVSPPGANVSFAGPVETNSNLPCLRIVTPPLPGTACLISAPSGYSA